jgi:hypothetical protein
MSNNQESRVRKMAKRLEYSIRKSGDGAFALIADDADEICLEDNLIPSKISSSTKSSSTSCTAPSAT